MSPRPSPRDAKAQRIIALWAGLGSMAVIFGLGAAILKFRPDPLEYRPVQDKKEEIRASEEGWSEANALLEHMRTNIGASAWMKHSLSTAQRARHHGALLEMWYDGLVQEAIRSRAEVAPGGVIVLRVVDGLGTPSATLAAVKKDHGEGHVWWYAEYDAKGNPVSFGRTERCLTCHERVRNPGVDRFLFSGGGTR